MRAAAAAALVALALVGAYAAAGGGRYRPHPVADPCAARPVTAADASALAGQVALSALDGAACSLGTTREALVLALASREDLERFAAQRGIAPEQVEEAARDGLRRAVDDAARAGALDLVTALALRAAIGRLPIEGVLGALRGTTLSW